ncbi:hypothetical protein [Mycolicibacterium fortuitum]|uniref:hypothetical protein n=1 Tax=Mycolicibacterium fortuitum TaxID=1766 RepID=UPI0010422F17|nr:hypothetical protein [Mycolicibacterium fortuitum]
MIAMGILALSLGGCTPSAPDIPKDLSPNEVEALTASDNGKSFLKQISVYHWDDQGAAAAELFAWVPEWAGSSDPNRQETAGQTAYTIAEFLSAESAALLNIETDRTIGDVNPILVSAYTDAIIPYLGQAVSNDSDAKGFKPLDPLDSSMRKTYSMLNVLNSDETSSSKLGQAVFDLIERNRKSLTVELTPGTDASEAAKASVLEVARLVGLASAIGIRPPDAEPLSFDIGVEQTEIDYLLARTSVSGPNNDITSQFFTSDGSLKPPGVVRTQLGEAGWEQYSGMLSRYLSRSKGQKEISNSFAHTAETIAKENNR